jgi:hypothetical protein
LTSGAVQVQDADMKKMSMQLSHRLLRIAVCLSVGLVLAGPELVSGADKKTEKMSPTPAQTNQAPGRLVITRSASLGPTIVGLRIDGKETAKITFNRRYDAPLSAGQHVLTVYPVVSYDNAKPTNTRVNVAPGQTYSFTAARNDVQLVLIQGGR